MTGWGQTGPRAKQAGHDFNYAALTGALWYASGAGDRPQTPPTVVGDIGGGALYLVIGMLTGILRARDTGLGCVVDAAIVDGAAHMMNLLMSLQSNNSLHEARGQSLLDGPHWSRCYACADGAYVSVQCLEPKFYAKFLDILGLTDATQFADQYNPKLWPDQSRALAAIFVAKPQSHWANLFEGSDACVAPVYSPWQAQNDPHIQHRGIWQEVDGMLCAVPAPRFEGRQPRVGRDCARNAHRDEILKMIGQTS
jgi:crotonobetainyl-CoA:carnitine CoA-transferase CaiB-like acyl-CoA transferase